MFLDNIEAILLWTQAAAASDARSRWTARSATSARSRRRSGQPPTSLDRAWPAVLTFTRSCAHEIGPFGIRVAAVSAGFVLGVVEKAWPYGVRPRRRARRSVGSANPRTRRRVLFLAAPDSRYQPS